MLADDLGYGDLSCYGSQGIETPNIDALAASGMKFSRFYAASAVCTPSRASILTGKFPLRYDIRGHFTDNEEYLPVASVTMPELLQKQGYYTAHIGKWHLGGMRIQDFEARASGKEAHPGPLQHGFDHYLVNIEGAPIRPQHIRNRSLYRQGGKSMVRNDVRAPESDKHWTEIKIDEAITVIDTASKMGKPFYLNMWFDVPHTPYEPAPEPHLSKYKELGIEGDQLLFRSMVSHLDENIGRLIAYLKEKGLYENTFILFTSDNGPAFQGSPGPFKGGKTDLHEGGIRVPMIASWPGKIKPNTHHYKLTHMTDLLPTFMAVAGNSKNLPEDLDGMNILPELLGAERMKARNTMFWQMDLYRGFQNQGPKPMPYATSVAINENWKLLTDSLQPTELFNLNQDHRELYNRLDREDSIKAQLLEELTKFHNDQRDRSWR